MDTAFYVSKRAVYEKVIEKKLQFFWAMSEKFAYFERKNLGRVVKIVFYVLRGTLLRKNNLLKKL